MFFGCNSRRLVYSRLQEWTLLSVMKKHWTKLKTLSFTSFDVHFTCLLLLLESNSQSVRYTAVCCCLHIGVDAVCSWCCCCFPWRDPWTRLVSEAERQTDELFAQAWVNWTVRADRAFRDNGHKETKLKQSIPGRGRIKELQYEGQTVQCFGGFLFLLLTLQLVNQLCTCTK